MFGTKLNAPVVAITATADGQGYWLLAKDGGVFAFNAPFYGSTGEHQAEQAGRRPRGAAAGRRLLVRRCRRRHLQLRRRAVLRIDRRAARCRAPSISMAPTPTGGGYYVLGVDGSVYPFGDAVDLGGVKGSPSPIVGMAVRPQGDGYWLVAADGTVTGFGAAASIGAPSASGQPPPPPRWLGSPRRRAVGDTGWCVRGRPTVDAGRRFVASLGAQAAALCVPRLTKSLSCSRAALAASRACFMSSEACSGSLSCTFSSSSPTRVFDLRRLGLELRLAVGNLALEPAAQLASVRLQLLVGLHAETDGHVEHFLGRLDDSLERRGSGQWWCPSLVLLGPLRRCACNTTVTL